MWKYCGFCGNWEFQDICSVCNEQNFRGEVFSEKIPVYVNFNWNSNNTLSFDRACSAQLPWLVDELQISIHQIVHNIWTQCSKKQIDKFDWWELREQILDLIKKLLQKTNTSQDVFLFDIWIGDMCLMCLVNERGEISPILGQGSILVSILAHIHFLGFTVMDWF